MYPVIIYFECNSNLWCEKFIQLFCDWLFWNRNQTWTLDIIGEVLEPPAYNDEFDKGRVVFPLWWRFIQYEELVINAVIIYQSLIHRQPNKHVSSLIARYVCLKYGNLTSKHYLHGLMAWFTNRISKFIMFIADLSTIIKTHLLSVI